MSNEESLEKEEATYGIDEETFALMQNDIDLLRKHNEAHPTLTGIEFEKCLREYLELSKQIAEEQSNPSGEFYTLAKRMGNTEVKLKELHAQYLFERGQYEDEKTEKELKPESFLIVPENPKLQ